MKRRGFAFVLTTCTGMSIVMLAGESRATEPDYAETGPYLGVGAAFGWDEFDHSSSLDADMAFGFDATGGYRLLSFLAAELQVEYLNGFDTRHTATSLIIGAPDSVFKSEAEAVTFTGNLKAYLPLGRFQPFALAGVGLGYVKLDLSTKSLFGMTAKRSNSDTDLAARFGGGFDFYVTEGFALQVSSSYVLQTGDLDRFDYVSLMAGLQYRF